MNDKKKTHQIFLEVWLWRLTLDKSDPARSDQFDAFDKDAGNNDYEKIKMVISVALFWQDVPKVNVISPNLAVLVIFRYYR